MDELLKEISKRLPAWLASYAALFIICVGALAVFIGYLNTILDFISRFRKPINVNAEIEQYRGNLIKKFRDLDKEIYSEIKRLKAQPKYPMICGAPPTDDQVDFLQNFRKDIDLIRRRAFVALDRGNIVEAHETLNDLRQMTLENETQLSEHQKAYKASMTMWPGGGGYYGTKIALTKIKLRALERLLENIEYME